MSSREHIYGFDYIRMLSAFMVVFLHSCVAYLAANRGESGWVVCSGLVSLCHVSVPLFFMVSGAVNMSGAAPVTLERLYRKKLPKLFIPFLIWSLIYVFARILTHKIPFALSSFTSLLYEPAYYQFWFIYTLLGIYLLLPLLELIVLNASRRQLEYLLILWGIFSLLIPTLTCYEPEIRLSKHVDLVLNEGYVGYFILGYYIWKYYRGRGVRFCAGLISSGYLLSLLDGWLQWRIGGVWGGGYLSIGTAIATTGMFLLLGEARSPGTERQKQLVRTLGIFTLNIYYVHMLFVTLLEKIGFSGEADLGVMVLKALISYLLSLLAAWGIALGGKFLHRAIAGGRRPAGAES